jgi:molybdenum cofactor guanylyltransferase
MAELHALILCGGQSERLGFPKFNMKKMGIPIYQHWINMLSSVCNTTYISCRPEQQHQIAHPNIIPDKKTQAGPLEGIYQAFQLNSQSNWLIIACDLVYVNKNDINRLINCNEDGIDAIAYQNPETNEVFPLLGIYNSSLLSSMETEYKNTLKSPKNMLQHSRLKLLIPDNPIILKGINTKNDYDSWQESLV